MKVILAGGGTGGHLYPGIAVAQKLHKIGVDTLFLVSDRGIDKQILDKYQYDYVEQDVSGFSGVSVIKKVKALYKLYKASKTSSQYIEDGDKVLILGGFAAAPAAIAAGEKKVDFYIHEQNSIMGLVNRLISKSAKKVFVSYSNTKKCESETVLVGNPIREELTKGVVKENKGKNILVVGGSGGSRILNKTFASISSKLDELGYSVRHQTGMKMYDETINAYKEADADMANTSVEPYISDMREAYEWCDVVVCRAGSGSVFEAVYSRRPAIFIPFAGASDNHQYFNALSMKNKGYCSLLEEKDLNADKILNEIEKMFAEIDYYNNNLANVKVLDSAELIVKNMNILE